MAATEEVLSVLRSIDASLKTLVSIAQRRNPAQKEIAIDRDLDGKYGDPKVTFNPRDWTGESMKRRQMSECPPEFLDMLAESLDYFAGQAEATNELYNGKPTAPYKRKDAARARGWAKRMRDGKHTPSAATEGGQGEWGDDVPEWGEEASH